MAIIDLQRRMVELGRIRMGDKKGGGKDPRRKLDNWRLTSASRALLEAGSQVYGGTVQEWQDAPDEGHYELYTEHSELDAVIPPVLSKQDGHPTLPYSQFYELWAGGGCHRRCDGETLVGGADLGAKASSPCICNADNRECKVTTRVSVMLPRLPGIGVWRLESHGIYAAIELPGTLELLQLAAEGNRFVPVVLRIEHRTDKRPGQPIKRYIVPVIDTPETTVGEMLSSINAPLAINAPAPRPTERPALSAGTTPPDETEFADAEESAGWGESPSTKAATPEADQLTATLRDLAKRLGSTAAVEKAIEKKGAETADEPGKYQAWLRTQIARAEAKLADTEPEQSDFVRMAQEAQAAKAR
jgi:hypothetical protein